MVGVAGNKPIAIGECWELPSAGRLAQEQLWTFFMSWSELTFQWPNTNAKIHSLYNSKEAITLGDMPGWTDASDDAPPNPSSADGWEVDYYSDGAIVVDLGIDHTINRIRIKIQNKTMSSNTTSNTNDTDVASVYVEDNQAGSIVMKGESDESTWELEVSHTESVNRNTDNNHNASPVEGDETKPVPTPTPDLNEDISKAPTKVFFEPATSLPTQILNDYAFLSNAHDTYLCSYSGGISLQASPEQKQKTWTKISLGSESKIALRSSHGRYLSAWWDSSMRMADHILGWELWTEITNDDGTVSFQSFFGTYLAAWLVAMLLFH